MDIPLGNGRAALVDDEDADMISQYTWFFDSRAGGYARASTRQGDRILSICMHHLVLPSIEGLEVDHINLNGLDNRRSNLRYATHSENQANCRLGNRNTTGLKGVHWDSRDRKYRAQITVNQQRIRLGRYIDAEDAALVYDAAARIFFRQYARLNFPLINELSVLE